MIDFFARHPTAANLLMVVIAMAGLFSLPRMRLETFPDFRPKQVEIRMQYPGASTEEVENALCERIERALAAVNQIEEVRSEAREGVAVVTAEMQEGGNLTVFLNEIAAEIDAVDDFPEEAEEPVVREVGSREPVVSVAVTGPMTDQDLRWLCVDLRDRLTHVEEIDQVTIEGFSERQIRVEISALDLMQYGLSVADVTAAIQRQNVDLPSGTLETGEQDVLVRFADERRSVDELAQLVVVSGRTGAEVRLGDVAVIRETFELAEEKIMFDGMRAGILDITKSRTEDALTIYDAVRRFVEREQAVVPAGVELTLTEDVSSIVRDRLALLVKNGWQGLLLVFLTMWLFFNLRLSFWVAMGLPVSFMGAIFFMALLGYSLNMITTVALLVTLGLLMDDAIVIAENVAKHLALGKRALTATVEGVSEVRNGVISSFLTTAVVFGPIAYLSGAIGQVLEVLPVVLLLVLLVSLVEAFLILPNHLAHALKHHDATTRGPLRSRLDSVIEWLREAVLGRAVDTAVRHRYLVTGATIMAFLLAAAMLAGGILKFQPFPEIDGDVAEARILMPQGTPLQQTEEIVHRLVAALERADSEFAAGEAGGEQIVKHVQVRYNQNVDAHESGPHVATIIADLRPAEQRRGTLDQFFALWRNEIGVVPDVLHIALTEPTVGPAGKAFEIRLQHADLDKLDRASQVLTDRLSSYRGVADVTDDLRPGKPELRVALRPGATTLGLSAQDVANQLRNAVGGRVADEFQIGSEAFEIDVRLLPEDRDSQAELKNLRIRGPQGEQIPLKQVATVTPERGWARIARVDGQRTATVQGDINSAVANAAEVTGDLANDLFPRLQRQFPRLEISLEGQAKETRLVRPSLLRGFAIGLIGIFVILSFQFRSYLQPLIVMAAIPCAFVGVVIGHLIMGLPLSMPSAMGFASLAGVVVNDSILLVEFVGINQRHGLSVAEAAAAASRDRMRAVMLTSLTTIVGLLPLLTESSLQAQILIPLATSIVFGLAASTVLVLVVLPAATAILGDLKVLRTDSPDGVS